MKSFIHITISLLFVAALAGCMNWSGDPGRYREILDGPGASTELVSFSADEPLSLTGALFTANANNEAIAIAGEDYIQALASKMRQAGAFLPTLDLSYGYNSSRYNNGDTTESKDLTAGASGDLSVSDIDDMGAANRTAEQTAQLLLDQRETILIGVAEAYYEVLRYQQRVQVLENSVSLQTERVREQQVRLEIGNGLRLDLAQSQADLASTRADLTTARTNAKNSRSALALLMGVDSVDGLLIDGFDAPEDAPGLNYWCEQAIENRQDLLAAERNEEASRQDVESAIHEYIPGISINFNYFLDNEPASAIDWTSAVSVNLPIFSAFSIEADIRSAWSKYRQSGQQTSQTRRQVIDDVRQALADYQSSLELIGHYQTQVEAAQAAFDLAERAYELGAGTNLDRLEQQDTLLNAKLDLVDSRYDLKVDYLQLLRSAGRLYSMLPGRSAPTLEELAVRAG